MPLSPRLPVFVTLRWVPGTMHDVQFILWGRTFVIHLSSVAFSSPQMHAPLYLLGSVKVNVRDITLSAAERLIFTTLERTVGRDNVLLEAATPGHAVTAVLA